MAIASLTRPEELQAVIAARGAGFIFKHSTRCGISAEADAALRAFAGGRPEVPVWIVLVVEDRPISNAVAEALGVPHASPQAILLRNGAPVWSATHWDITPEALAGAWSRVQDDSGGAP